MKFAQSSVIALLAPAVAGRFTEANEPENVQLYPMGFYEASTEQYLIELEHGVTRWVTEDEKWELRRVSLALFPARQAIRSMIPLIEIEYRAC